MISRRLNPHMAFCISILLFVATLAFWNATIGLADEPLNATTSKSPF